MTWSDNMDKKSEAIVNSYNNTTNFTEISFEADLKRFKMNNLD
jgi:hypothetical protein